MISPSCHNLKDDRVLFKKAYFMLILKIIDNVTKHIITWQTPFNILHTHTSIHNKHTITSVQGYVVADDNDGDYAI